MATHRRGTHRAHRTAARRVGATLLAAAAMAATLLVPTAPAQAIVQGEPVRYPWAAVFVEPGSSHITARTYCSGVLLKPAWVLTAAHCTDHVVGDTVIIGRGDLDSNQGQVRQAWFAFQMPTYPDFCPSRSRTLCDVALVRLRAASTQPDLDLAGRDVFSQWGEGTRARTYGYGVTFYDPISGVRHRSTGLRRGHFRIDDFRQNHHTLFASDDPTIGGESAACFGDSGAPLVVSTSKGPRVAGFFRALSACAPGETQSYVKVGWRGNTENSPVYRWITWRI